MAALLPLGDFFLFLVPLVANGRRDKNAKGVKGLVDFRTTSLLDTRVILPAKGVACRSGDFSRLLRPTLRLYGGGRNGSLMVVRIVVTLELVRFRGNIFVVHTPFLCRVRRFRWRSGGFRTLNAVRGGIDSSSRHWSQQGDMAGREEGV